ncbi:hypothetical protein, partial [Salmonella enterica]|uniref:hypothetical protein n=1 Tax=Salmonella enterica TaxID=28901 RepID=UPI001C9E50C8
VGNCQTSNKTKGSVERLGLLFYLWSVGGSAIRQPAPPDGRFALSGLHALIRQRRYSRIN